MPLFGGRSVRGGYVIDFVVDVNGETMPLEVQSLRWHQGKYAREEAMREARVEQFFGTEIRYVWEDELTSKEDAIIAVRKALYNPVKKRV